MYSPGGNVKCAAVLDNSLEILKMLNMRVTILTSKSTPKYIPKITKNIYPNTLLYTNVHHSIIHKILDLMIFIGCLFCTVETLEDVEYKILQRL